MTHQPQSHGRRTFLRQTGMAGAATLVAPLEGLMARTARGLTVGPIDGYGPLEPVRDESTGEPLLLLPRGFRYLSYGWTGDPLDDGGRTPGAHDGMAAFAWRDGRVRLVRNHEVGAGPVMHRERAYDPAAGGGTTNLEFDPGAGKWMGAWASLAGTIRNCAGGPTPWGTWLTCEESVDGPQPDKPFTRPHGYVFEVPLDGVSSAEPIVDMGRFVHEAVAIDPSTGIAYLTEDQRSAGLYRFVPKKPGAFAAGGRLEMLAIANRRQVDTRKGQTRGVEYRVSWVPVPDPARAHEGASASDARGVFSQGWERGGAMFARLEGATFADGKIYVTATSGGEANMGQVWELDPARQRLRLIFESPGADVLNMPDNVCPSPQGALLLCEDGTANPSMHALTRDGRIVRFARNNLVLSGATRGLTGDFRHREFAGATFSPDGRWLFVNVQTPGMTMAITGPWENGPL